MMRRNNMQKIQFLKVKNSMLESKDQRIKRQRNENHKRNRRAIFQTNYHR